MTRCAAYHVSIAKGFERKAIVFAGRGLWSDAAKIRSEAEVQWVEALSAMINWLNSKGDRDGNDQGL